MRGATLCLVQKVSFVFCSSLARAFALSTSFAFAYPDPFLDFFFPSSIVQSDLSFSIRDPQQFTAARIWGRLKTSFIVIFS
jgi:hypothetical protein